MGQVSQPAKGDMRNGEWGMGIRDWEDEGHGGRARVEHKVPCFSPRTFFPFVIAKGVARHSGFGTSNRYRSYSPFRSETVTSCLPEGCQAAKSSRSGCCVTFCGWEPSALMT